MVGIELYGFAFFVFCLVCLALVVYSKLFSDVRRQKKLLDEKENKLLKLYQSIEEALDEFNDSVEKGHDELDAKVKAFERRLEVQSAVAVTPPAAVKREPPRRALPRERLSLVDVVLDDDDAPPIAPQAGLYHQEPVKPETPPVSQAEEVKPEFKSLLDTVRQVEVVLPQSGANRNDAILTLSQQGSTRSQIAKELGITLSEVDLVLGMSRSR